MGMNNVNRVGIEYDNSSIRAVRMKVIKKKKNESCQVEKVIELKDDFSKPDKLVEGLKKVKKDLQISNQDSIRTTLSGKQIYAAVIPFQHLPESEMATALRFEIRKNISFESTGAVIDYQILKEGTKNGELATVLVCAVSASLLHKLETAFNQAGIHLSVVEVLPITVANIHNSVNGKSKDGCRVLIHFSPNVCTFVADGEDVPFYTRNIYFSADEVLGDVKSSITEKEKERRIEALGEELKRTLTFFEKSNSINGFDDITIVGHFADSLELKNMFIEKIGTEPAEREFLNDGKFVINNENMANMELAVSLTVE